MLKRLPPARFDLLFPPVRESEHFRYFSDAASHPFRHEARSFELVNAWWLAEASLLAYAREPFVREKFRSAGLEVAAPGFDARSRTRCYVAYDGKCAITVFRGTEVLRPDGRDSLGKLRSNLAGAAGDVQTDLEFALAPWTIGSARFVHRGFGRALEDVWPALEQTLQALRRSSPARSFWFAGHSLGAALATLAADRFGVAQGVYTFGSPRVGDTLFAQGFGATCFRWVNNSDIVPHLPPAGPYLRPKGGVGRYCHVGVLKHIDPHGRLVAARGPWWRLRDWVRGQRLHFARGFAEARAGRPWGLAADALTDHSPLAYAVKVWNLYAVELLAARAEGPG
jgi:triacylglycerol lipase